MGESQPQIPQDEETTDSSASKKRRGIFRGKGLAIFGAAAVATGVGAAAVTSGGGERAQPDSSTPNEIEPANGIDERVNTFPQTESLGPLTVDSSTETGVDTIEDQKSGSEDRVTTPEFPNEDVVGDGIPDRVPGTSPNSDMVITHEDGSTEVVPADEVITGHGVSGGVSVEQSNQPVSGGAVIDSVPQTPGPIDGGVQIEPRQ